MASSEDDEAFTFPGDDEPAIAGSSSPEEPSGIASSDGGAPDSTESGSAAATARDTLSEGEEAGEPGLDERPSPLPAPMLIFYGFVSGWMVLYAIGWLLVAIGGWSSGSTSPMVDVLSNVTLILMVCSPLLWLVAVLVATRGRRLRTAWWMLIGIVLLMPWPYFLGQTGASS